MPGIAKVANSRFQIGQLVPYKSVVTLADFSGQTWQDIGQVSSLGDLGVEQETLSQVLVNNGLTLYSKGAVGFPTVSNEFIPDIADAGQIQFKTAQSLCFPYAFRILWGADCAVTAVVTITIAVPGVITWTAHGLAAGAPVYFATTGALPTGILPGVLYYVIATGLTANTFQIAATPGGTAITTTGTQSGVQTGFAQAVGDTNFFFGLALKGMKTGGDASAIRKYMWSVQPICEPLEV